MIDGQFISKIIQYLESKGKTLNEALLTEAGARATWAFRRQLMEEREAKAGVLRMSSGGNCARKQWYAYKGEAGEPLSGRTMVTFLNGDLLEVAVSILGRLAGWQLLGKENGEDEIQIPIPILSHRGEPEEANYVVTGHPDDLLNVPEENEMYLMEYKTMSEYGFREFEKSGLDDTWGYFTQCSLYCTALGLKKFILVAVCKNTGHMADRVYEMSDALVQKAKENWSAIINKDEMPERKFDPEPETVYNRSKKVYDPTGRLILPVNCSYCQMKMKCWPGVRVDTSKSKPVFVIGNVGGAV